MKNLKRISKQSPLSKFIYKMNEFEREEVLRKALINSNEEQLKVMQDCKDRVST